MTTELRFGETVVDVVRKDIKNVHLSVHPPTGRVRISAPSRMNEDTIRVFVLSKLDWIKRHQQRMREQTRETRRDYVDRESHYVWGRRCLLTVEEDNRPPSVELRHRRMILTVRPGSDVEKRKSDRRDVVPESDSGRPSTTPRDVGTGDRRDCGSVLCPSDEDEVGKLQP